MKIKLFFILILCVSCGSTNKLESVKQSPIVYIFPSQVESILKNHLLQSKKNDVYLELRRENDIYSLIVSDLNIFWKPKSNRKAVVNNKLYPLIFDLDAYFGSAEEADVVLKRLKSESKEKPFFRKSLSSIYDNAFMIKFKINGEVLFKGSSW